MRVSRKRPKLRARRISPGLNINSMMDMMTILLLFLLKSYSTEGALVTPAEDLEIPVSETTQSAKPSLEVKVSEKFISVHGKVVADVEDALAGEDMVIEGLLEVLEEAKQQSRLLNDAVGGDFASDDLVIQGDRKIPYKLLTRVMYTSGQAGFSKQRFVVYQKE